MVAVDRTGVGSDVATAAGGCRIFFYFFKSDFTQKTVTDNMGYELINCNVCNWWTVLVSGIKRKIERERGTEKALY